MTIADELVGKDQCPACAARGQDTSKDNLAIYRDGHEWCFACGYRTPAKLEHRVRNTITVPPRESKAVTLPSDASVNIPGHVLDRCLGWGMTKDLIDKHKFMWSEQRKRLIMPVYDVSGHLLMYQERSFDITQTKYLTTGAVSDILHILYPEGDRDNSVVILTEDLISAIKVSMYKPAMPIWGAGIPLKTIRKLASQFSVVGVWLDPDMKLKAVKDVLRVSQYVPAFFVNSNLDPKFYNRETIKEHIDIAGYKMIYKDTDSASRCVTDKSLPCVSDDTHLCNCVKKDDGTVRQWQTARLG